jgi:CRP/FNR family transcriptional regulator, transcriptional activator FtrB
MRSHDLEEMRALPIFRGVPDQHVETMLQASFLQRFPSHVELVREGDAADFLHVVVDGQVELFSAHRDRETTVGVIGAGQSFIVAAVLMDRIYLKSARVLSQARILMIPSDIVRRYFAENAIFARTLAIELAMAYRGVVKELKNQKLRSSLERLANWILAQDRQMGHSGQLVLPFDKKVLASRLGMAPEVLSRSFAALVPYRVTVNGASITIGDHDALINLAHPSPTIDDPAI